MYQTRIIHKKEIAEDVFEIRLEKPFSFVPGQMVSLRRHPEDPERLYSLSGGQQEETLRILFDLQKEGMLTPVLAGSRPGDPFWISDPGGEFLYSGGPVIWIATGTGIAPFLSMMRSGRSAEVHCIHGARAEEGFYFQEEWLEALGDRYIRCLSRGLCSGCYTGRLTQYLREWKELPADRHFMLCGSTEMVVQVRDLLLSRGVPFTLIGTEIYF